MWFLGARLGVVTVRGRDGKNISIIIGLIIFMGSKVAEQERMCNAMEGMRSNRLCCNIGNVEFRSNVTKTNKTSSNSFADAHDRACKMFLLDLG